MVAPSLTVSPQPVSPGFVVDVDGAGFDPLQKYRLTLDGAGATTNIGRPRRDGSFRVGIKVAGAPKTQTIVGQQATGSSWKEAARVSVVVAVPTPLPGPVVPTNAWLAEYFDNVDLAGTPKATVASLTSLSAAPATGVGPTNYSIRHRGLFAFEAKDYDFTFRVDDGLRVYIDGGRVPGLDVWKQQSPTTYTQRVSVAAGLHEIKVEYFQLAGEAVLEGAWKVASVVPPPPPLPPITGPFPGFAKADAQVAPGGVVDVPPGIYKERFTLTKPGVTWRLASGAQVDLTGMPIAIQQGGVTLKGDDIKFIGQGRIFGSSGAGYVVDGHAVTVTVEVDHCVEEGYVWHGQDGLMKDGSNHHNNETGQKWDGSEQGAGKANTKRLTIDGVYVHHLGLGGADPDAGQGLWYDSIGQISSGEVKNCVIHDVFYAGIFFEISDGGKLHDNVIYRCGNTPSGSGFWGAGLLASSSRNVDIYGNVIAFCKWNGIRVLMQQRPDRPGITTGVAVHDNTLIGNGTQVSFGTDDAANAGAMFDPANGNKAFANKFDVPRVFWQPRGMLTSLADINSLPGGGGSSVLTAAERAAVLATYGI